MRFYFNEYKRLTSLAFSDFRNPNKIRMDTILASKNTPPRANYHSINAFTTLPQAIRTSLSSTTLF